VSTEKRLIDANALLAELDKFVNPMPDTNGLHFLGGISTAITEIEDAPTVDAVVLPFKVGDTVWIAGDKFPAEIERIIIDADGISFEYVEYDRGRELTEVWDDGSFKPEDIGKTVFLTQEEAGRRERE